MSAKSRRAARAARDLTTFPQVFFNIAAAHAAGQDIPPLRQPDGGGDPGSIARANQKLFSKFRKALMSNGHPHAISVLDLICRVTNVAAAGERGKYYLEFVPRGLAILADEVRPSRGGDFLQGIHGAESPLRDERYEVPHIPGLDTPSDAERREQIARDLQSRDIGEEILMQHLEKSGKLKLQNIDEGCKHEWDTAGTHCVKCKAPKP